MNAFCRYRLVPAHCWLFGVLLLLFLPACATTSSAGARPSEREMVDIGYGTVDPDHQTGSVVTLDGPGTGENAFRSLGDMLSKIPGIQVQQLPGGRISVRIRGTNSFLGGKEPLWVVDGVTIQTGAGLAGINPSAIQSVTVLKDPGETAVFGSRGANGVILVRMRSGR
jgi:TonB-dependent starch-binding outer membrane protein SusC